MRAAEWAGRMRDRVRHAPETAPHDLRASAVLVPIIWEPRPCLILTKRAAHLPYHAGQVCFPGGKINAGAHTDKKDVIDKQDRAHSVKAGTWWQIFLYGEERLKTNSIFQGMGNVANIMLDCLNAYPPSFAEYQKNKKAAKQALRPHMRALLTELQKPNILRAFLDKALFDGGKADFLSIYPSAANDPQNKKHLNSPAMMKILLNSIKPSKQLKPNVTVYGKATHLMK